MAAIVGNDVVVKAAELTKDQKFTLHQKDWYLKWVSEAVGAVLRLMPSSRVKTDGTLITYAEVTDIGATLLLSDFYLLPLAEYVAYKHFTEAGRDSESIKQRDYHWQQFLFHIRGGR